MMKDQLRAMVVRAGCRREELMWYLTNEAEAILCIELECPTISCLYGVETWWISAPEKYQVILGSRLDEWALGLTYDGTIERCVFEEG